MAVENLKTVVVKFPDRDISALDLMCREDDRSRNSMIRLLVKSYVKENMTPERWARLGLEPPVESVDEGVGDEDE